MSLFWILWVIKDFRNGEFGDVLSLLLLLFQVVSDFLSNSELIDLQFGDKEAWLWMHLPQ